MLNILKKNTKPSIVYKTFNTIRSFNSESNSNHLIKVNIQDREGRFFEVMGEYNDSLYDIIKKNKTLESNILKDCLECSCEGVMACSTCHVHVDEDWFKVINKPCEYEEDMLDLAYDRKDTSKLGCQLRLKPYLNGINITLPNGKNNFY